MIIHYIITGIPYEMTYDYVNNIFESGKNLLQSEKMPKCPKECNYLLRIYKNCFEIKPEKRPDIKDIILSMLYAKNNDLKDIFKQVLPFIINTIEENIKIGNTKATHEQVVDAAKKASIHDFISSLPDGYKTRVGELGDHLSGGERQRIGVARAFLHDANLILLDEPTSNLDSLNEAIILKSINEERKKKTIVLVSHRESTIKAADRIFLVENGRLS